MAVEIFANEATATLNMGSTLSSSATSITVTGQVNCPSGGNFRIRIDSEYMKVTAVSGNTWTVVRQDGGTTAATHADGSTIYIILTKEALDSLITLTQSGTDVCQRRRLNFLGATIADDPTNNKADITISQGVPWEDSVTEPVLSNFSWVNQGSASAAQTSKNALWLTSPALNGNSVKALTVAKPGTNWTAIIRLGLISLNAQYHFGGFCVRDSSTSRLQLFGRTQNNYCIQNYTSQTAWNSTPYTQGVESGSRDEWWKFNVNGSTLTWSRGPDGESWVQLTTTTTTGWTATPDQIGIFMDVNNSTYAMGLLLSSWATSSP